MNLNMIRPRNEKEDILLSITINCEQLFRQTHRKRKKLQKFSFTNQEKSFFSIHLYRLKDPGRMVY